MKNLKTIYSLFFLMLATGCATSFFRIKNESNFATELLVTPDRIVLQCEELDEDPDVGAYGFIVHLLDEQNTVTAAALNIRPDKENCERHIKKMKPIIKHGHEIYIGGRMKLSKQPRVLDDEFPINFPKRGTFIQNGRSLEFIVMMNEHGECYSPGRKDDEECPPFPFPLEKYKDKLGLD